MQDESDADANLDIPIHAFDVVITDECHPYIPRKEESEWREVLKHFDGIRIGLIATPRHIQPHFKDVQSLRYE